MSFSMTGYGQSALQHGGYKVVFEVKSVNHRYCEVVLRLPREWTCFEDSLRRTVQQYVKRGRVDVYVNKEEGDEHTTHALLNEQAVQTYLLAAQDLSRKHGLDGELTVKDLLSLPGVWIAPEHRAVPADSDLDEWGPVLESGLRKALEGLSAMRSREGKHLAADVEQRLSKLQVLHGEMLQLAPTVVEDYRNKLKQRLSDLNDGSFAFDEHKFGMEVAIFADRSNIDEELIRLQSHFEQCKGLLRADEPVGRKLDFLIQEMNREVNTIGSKANHLTLVNRVVEMKAELEKIREQLANIE
ncbi:YicC family protein [Paenibacillus sp. HJL G12]|uniref:YicC family protein n=1 Tax=Paenibacillus dendrobii TaxID=2691084 RepID=A0A7X3IJJ9_9BACL|nr:YicC/YloC family endoribonuclease [Paenibacillus dendrobii]MWV45138.1 YicC family protein [Paenibacillus dendrobii]